MPTYYNKLAVPSSACTASDSFTCPIKYLKFKFLFYRLLLKVLIVLITINYTSFGRKYEHVCLYVDKKPSTDTKTL